MRLMPAFDVITVGSATQDIFLQSAVFDEVRNPLAPDGIDACIPLGSKVDLKDMVIAHGGGAMNAAVTFSRLGLKTACAARIGRDEIGKGIRLGLAKERISDLPLQTDPSAKTASSIILVSGSGHRAILTHRGASMRLRAKAIPWKTLSTRWLYITSLGGDLRTLHELFSVAAKKRIYVAWNPGHAELLHGYRLLAPYLANTSVLIINREEGALVTEQSPRHTKTIIETVSFGMKGIVLLTDGAHGAYVRFQQKTLFAPAIKAQRVNTTGAGDAFGSGFVATCIREKDTLHEKTLADAARVATLNAAGVISRMGAQAGILRSFPSAVARRRAPVKQAHL